MEYGNKHKTSESRNKVVYSYNKAFAASRQVYPYSQIPDQRQFQLRNSNRIFYIFDVSGWSADQGIQIP